MNIVVLYLKISYNKKQLDVYMSDKNWLFLLFCSFMVICDANAAGKDGTPVSKETMRACALQFNKKDFKQCCLDNSDYNPDDKIYCDAGKYLPANSGTCSACKSRYYLCVGGSFAKMSYSQGMRKCPSGQFSSADNTNCVVRCISGKYLPANRATCVTCKDRYYCSGGDFAVKNYDQGIKKI